MTHTLVLAPQKELEPVQEEPPKKTNKGRKKGSHNFSEEEVMEMLETFNDILPVGSICDWRTIR